MFGSASIIQQSKRKAPVIGAPAVPTNIMLEVLPEIPTNISVIIT